MSIQGRFDADIELSPEAYVIQELWRQLTTSHEAWVTIDTPFARGVREGLRQSIGHLSGLCESQGVTPPATTFTSPEEANTTTILDLMAALGESLASASLTHRAMVAVDDEPLCEHNRVLGLCAHPSCVVTTDEDENEAAMQARADASMADRAFDALGAE